MPLISFSAITDYPFQPFTKIYSSDINLMFSTISTLLNTTKLDYLNVQTHGLTRLGSSSNLAAGTANYVNYNNASGDLIEAAQLPPAQGGLGADLTPAGPGDSGKAILVNAAGTGFQLAASSNSGLNVFNYYNLG